MPASVATKLLECNPEGLETAAEILRQGGLVAFATETVYGLGADATNSAAVADIYQAKARPSFNPLIVHVADLAGVERLVTLNDTARKLAAAFWPGPFTMVLPLRTGAGISDLVTAGLNTLAVRIPANAAAQDLLRAFGGPVAAPSANRSGRISPTTAAHVMAELDGRIDAVLDGGPCPVGVESTIVGLAPQPTLLRPGGIPTEDVEAALGQPLAQPDSAPDAPTAPGQLASHYAPDAQLRLNAAHPNPGERVLGFGDVPCDLNLSPTGDLKEAAMHLFAALRQLDAAGSGPIAVSPIPDVGLGRAINDRLQRAAAPRP